MDVALEETRLERLSVGELRDRYTALFRERSYSRNRRYLIRRILWQMQAQAEGDHRIALVGQPFLQHRRFRQRAHEREIMIQAANMPGAKPVIRMAIYTRKSTDENLDDEMNSLEVQRETAEAYIASQKAEGWVALPQRYDDGNCSGGNTDRPAFKRLMADIEAGRVDGIVVYKLDRLSRSILDFAKMMEVFDAKGIALVSVTQQFNTSTSLGRLIVHILLSFAQFGCFRSGQFAGLPRRPMAPDIQRGRGPGRPFPRLPRVILRAEYGTVRTVVWEDGSRGVEPRLPPTRLVLAWEKNSRASKNRHRVDGKGPVRAHKPLITRLIRGVEIKQRKPAK